jgi:O-antigen/teichoic acid export membrane protein
MGSDDGARNPVQGAEPRRAPSGGDLLDSSAAGSAAIRGGTLRVAAYALGTVAGVGAAALLFRHLGVVDTGLYSVATALVAIVAGVTDLGLTAIGVRELSVRTGAARDAIARNLLGLRLATSVVGAIGITVFAAVAGYESTLVVGVGLAGVGLVLLSVQSALAMSLVSDLRLGWVATFELLRALLSAALILALVAAGAHLLAFLAVTIPVGVVVLALNAWKVRGRIPLRPAFRVGDWWSLIKNVLPYSVAVAAGTLYFYMAVVLVSLFSNGHALGYFGVSARVIQVLLVLPGLAVGAAFPIFSRAARDDRVRLAYAVGRVFEVSLMLGVLISLCLAIGSSLVIHIVGGDKFRPAASILAIQGIGLGASFSGAVWSNGLLSLGRHRAILAVNIFALVFGSVLVAVLVSLDGARGAAIATAAGELVLAGLSGAALTRADRSLAPPMRVVPAVVVATTLAVATTLVHLPVLVSVVVAGAVYVATLLVLGAVPQELRQELRRRAHVSV